MTDSNSVVLWNQVAQQAVINTKIGPTISSRAYSMVHTAIFDAWAAYDPIATSTQLGNTLQRPASENTDANKNEAMSYAAYRTLVDLFPTQVALFDGLMAQLGYDPNNQTSNITTAAGIGNVSARALLTSRHGDGSNQLNGYADTTGYQSVNTADSIVDPSRWQPLRVPSADPNGTVQKYLTPQWGQVTPFGLTSTSEFRPPAPIPYRLADGTVNPAYVQQVQNILDLSANLTDEQKIIAEYWEDGGGTSFPPGHWLSIGQFVSERDGHTVDEDAQMFFALGNAVMDAGIATWEAKRYYDYGRPITAIHYLFAGQQVTAWGGPGQGTQIIDGSDWQPYQSPNIVTPSFPEYTSGHSAFSAAGAEILKRFTGSDANGQSITIPAGDSRFEPGLTPATDITLSWDTFSDAADQAGISREYGGIHFQDGDLQGRALGREVGAADWDESQLFVQAGLAAPPSLTATTNNLLTITGSGIPAQLKFTLTQSSSSSVNEVGVFVVDDDQGTVNGISPGSAGYVEAALARGQVILSALSNLPNGYSATGQIRQLNLPTNKPLMFYLVQNVTADTVRANGANAGNVFFSLSSANSDNSNHLQVSDLGNGAFNLAWEDGLGGGNKSFNDLVLNAQVTNPSSLNDWAGLHQGEREIIDLSLQADVVSANFVVNREAAYDDFVGFYKVVDLKGGIDVNGDGKVDLNPGDAGYAQAAIAERVDINLSVANQGTANITGQLPGGGFLAPFMIANGTPEAFLAQNASNQPGEAPIACFSFLGANPDQVDHIRLLADNTFGFEDLFGGGDKDFNDLVVKVNLA
jgi:hypothetical protein